MGNCLKTQLKASVNNDNLNKFGTLVIKVLKPEAASENPGILLVRNVNAVTLGSYNTDYTKYIVDASDVQNVHTIASYATKGLIEVDTSNLALCDSLNIINVYHQQISGVLNLLPSSIKTLCLGDYNGTLSEVTHVTSLVELRVCTSFNFKLSGNLEDFVAAQIQKGRTTCSKFVIGMESLPSYILAGGIYFNNQELTGGPKIVTWNWDGSSANITVTDV